MRRRIPVAEPSLSGNERSYVMDCLESNWISSTGKYIGRFEEEFAAYCGTAHAVSCSNGTVALHLALLSLGIGPGDEVIVPTLTFVATANAVTYCGARPVFVDSEWGTWNLDPDLLEQAITVRTKAIIAVHLYGQPADMDRIRAIADRHDIYVIEDAAEAHGAEYHERKVGSLGNIGTFSFYGNKIITTGEGGMLVTDSDEIAQHARTLRGQGMDPARRYWFPVLGYNYRLTNIAAAIGCAQLEKIHLYIEQRREVACWYREFLADCDWLRWQQPLPGSEPVCWMVSVMVDPKSSITQAALMSELDHNGIETRPVFPPMHSLPIYAPTADTRHYPVAEMLSQHAINLPTSVNLCKSEVEFVCHTLCEITANTLPTK